MKKMFILVAALIGLSSLAPITASTAETMYKDLVEPIMQSHELPVDKACKLHDLQKTLKNQRDPLLTRVFYRFGAQYVTASVGGAFLGRAIGEGLNKLSDIYCGYVIKRDSVLRLLGISLTAFAALIFSEKFLKTKEYWEKTRELSTLIRQIDVLIEQLPKEYQKPQSS